MRDVSVRPADWSQIAEHGFLDPPGPNAARAATIDVYHPRPSPAWYPGLVVRLAASLGLPITLKSLPGSSGVDRHAAEGTPRHHYAVFDNRFLLSLRMRRPFRDESSAALGTSHPPITHASEMRLLALRPNVYHTPMVTGWPRSGLQFPTFGGE